MTLTTFTGYAPSLTLSREKRTITGRIVEFGTPTSDFRRIIMHEGALIPREPLNRVKMLRDHDSRDPVGFMLAINGDEATFKIPEGENGDRALAEAEAGLRDGLSVGIQVSTEPESFMYDEADNTYHVYRAELLEVSLVAIPAYAGAGVTTVNATRSTQEVHPMPTPAPALTNADLEAALERFGTEQDRLIEQRFAQHSPTVETAPQFANFGALIRAAVKDGDADAIEYAQKLAYEGATTGDDYKHNAWVGDTVNLVEQNRKTLNSFTKEPLPAEGMTLEYVTLESNSITVEKQDSEGANLKFGKVKLGSDTATVDTYGGYTELSRQAIERGSALYTNTAFKAMDLEYARATEAATRTLLKATITAQIAADNKIALAADADANAWLDLIVDAIEAFEDRGYSLEGGKVSKDVFKRLMRLEDGAGHRLMLVSGQGVNAVGELNLSQISAKLGPVTFELLPGAAANTGTFYNPLAITTWESAGAPWQLDHENNIALTKSFSKYGYLAQAAQHPDALLPIEFLS